MPKQLRRAGFLLGLLIIGTASFFLTRAFFPLTEEVKAAGPPPPTIREERKRLLEEDGPKPLFVGELNGFTFITSDSAFDGWALLRARSPKCNGTNSRYVDEAQATRSRADFTATYLPPDTQPSSMTVIACEDDVFNIQRNYSDGRGLLISVVRVMGPAVTGANAPRERMEATTVGERQAVIIRGVFREQGTEILMRDSAGLWDISARGDVLEELIKVAGGLR